MPRIFAIGETVYDIIFKNSQPVAAKAGGSMLNTSVSLGRLGLDVNFVSDLGKDMIGDTIIGFLTENGVSTNFIERYENRKTAIAIAFLDENNDASYTFYKDFPENRLSSLKFDFNEGDIILFGSFFALTENIRPVLLNFLHQARDIPLQRYGDPEELANVIVFLGSERASYLTGATISVDGGMLKGLF